MKVIRFCFIILIRALSMMFSYNSYLWLKGCRDRLYSMWICNFIGERGEHISIHYPCSLQGGGSKNISIGDYTCIQSHSILGCWERYSCQDADGNRFEQHFNPEIIIGNNCVIGEYTQITAINKITIGDGLLTGRYVYIGDNAHGGLTWKESDIPPIQRRLKTKGEIVIGNNVWIGDKVTILSGVTIGDNVIIGANSVVTHDVPSNTVAIGMPARLLKSL